MQIEVGEFENREGSLVPCKILVTEVRLISLCLLWPKICDNLSALLCFSKSCPCSYSVLVFLAENVSFLFCKIIHEPVFGYMFKCRCSCMGFFHSAAGFCSFQMYTFTGGCVFKMSTLLWAVWKAGCTLPYSEFWGKFFC